MNNLQGFKSRSCGLWCHMLTYVVSQLRRPQLESSALGKHQIWQPSRNALLFKKKKKT